MKKTTTIKPIKAWAIMAYPGEIQAWQFDYRYNKHYSIFPTRKEALAFRGRSDAKIKPVFLTFRRNK